MKIAVPINASSMDQFLKDIHRVSKNPEVDLLEYRIDYIKQDKPDIRRLLDETSKPVIVTNRHMDERGSDIRAGFEGSEEERIEYLQEAIHLNTAYVDIEFRHFHNFDRKDKSIRLIISYHDFEKTPELEELNSIYDRISISAGKDIVKIATMAQNEMDCIKMYQTLSRARSLGKNMIGICIGQKGMQTRILGPVYGSYLTFAILSQEGSTAKGQPTIENLRKAAELMQLYKSE
jgi:3-dehydroquinate dehydratase-1